MPRRLLQPPKCRPRGPLASRTSDPAPGPTQGAFIGLQSATASRHLRYLREAGPVEARPDGRWCFHSLAEAESGFHSRLLDGLGSCFGEVPELEGDAEGAGRLRDRGGCCAADEIP